MSVPFARGVIGSAAKLLINMELCLTENEQGGITLYFNGMKRTISFAWTLPSG